MDLSVIVLIGFYVLILVYSIILHEVSMALWLFGLATQLPNIPDGSLSIHLNTLIPGFHHRSFGYDHDNRVCFRLGETSAV